ncbi:hypothetical protein MTAT_28060 [Moorella thermoacetica]|uniref:Uncharacterized protein n=1 Tax=Neomoorella thermoacetica TaxID=1525 RepID=A0AAC9HFF9_NEOTH|nr:hypothetical protein Maut_00523 [Moorella thermoacetica]TYL07942.1 hypothetical protein MTAT_28060 [Moorella thermoacetica]
MTKKRGNNEGIISKRKDGRWCAAKAIFQNLNRDS